MKFQSLGIALLLIANQAVAVENVEKWSGSGAVFSPDGQRVQGYLVDVENTDLGTGLIQSDVTFVFDDGTKKVTFQKLAFKGSKWRIDSNLGKGGGTCYGPDICENYISAGSGREFATTIINDGRFARRNVTFELVNGKVTQVLRDQLVKQP